MTSLYHAIPLKDLTTTPTTVCYMGTFDKPYLHGATAKEAIMSEKVIAEYIWLDGYAPEPNLRSKAKVLDRHVINPGPKDLPAWGFDGSSTRQAEGVSSDCRLVPVCVIPDPLRGRPHLLVLCEVLNADGSVHASNTRHALVDTSTQFASEEPLFGIEQEYTLFKNQRPLGFPKKTDPPAQGKYYCGTGVEAVAGRRLVERHLHACLTAGLGIVGINAEVMLGQWEYQIGTLPPLEVCDHLQIARWLMQRIGETMGIEISLAPKPWPGDWNGAGAHTNFSTKAMRSKGGMKIITRACRRLKRRHDHHIRVYGNGNEKRLTGKHETCSIDEFRFGISDRGASIRIPLAVADAGYGYLEDRRPAANCDPYVVCTALLETVCGKGFVSFDSSRPK